MAKQHATRPRPLRVVKGRPAETPILDLAEAVRMYRDLADQAHHLDGVMGELRGRILRAMERSGLEDFYTDGVHAIRQVRHFAPELDEEQAKAILERAGRLREAERTVLDPEKAREILDQLHS